MLPEELARSERRAELEVLVACSRVVLRPADEARLAVALAGELDWDYLLRTGNVNGISPLLHRHLAGGAAGPVPAAVWSSLHRRQVASTQFALVTTAALAEALRALGAAGIEAIPFKGPLLASAVYGDLGLRPFRDVDILLRPEDVCAAVELLAAAGWKASAGQGAPVARLRCAWVSDLVLARGGLLLELHWRLTQPYFGIADTLGDLDGELAPVEVAGVAARTLSPTWLLFYLCAHGATHRWPRLEWICDVAELLRRDTPVDWDRLLRRARANGAARMLGLGVLLAHDLLGAPLPSVVAPLAGDARVRALARAVYRHLPDESPDSNPGLKLVPFHLAMRERWRDRARYAAVVLLAPSPLDLDAVPLPPALYPLYFVVRPLRLAVSHARGLLRRPPPARRPA